MILERIESVIQSIDLAPNESSRVFPYSKQYSQSITSSVLLNELWMNILGALVCVFLCTLLFLGNLPITIIVCCTVSITLLDVAGKYEYKNAFD